MTDHSPDVRKPFRLLALCGALLLLLGACGSKAARVEPPQAPKGSTGVVVKASARDLALTRTDMPAGFQLTTEKSQGPDYLALYLRPSALEEAASGGNKLLSVLVSVGVYASTAAADEVYRTATTSAAEEGLEAGAMISKGAKNVVTAPFEGVVQGADASEAYRVSYQLLDQNVFEYGHRFRLGNVLAHVVVTAIGDPDEPEQLLEATRDLVQRQVDRIVEAATQGPSQ